MKPLLYSFRRCPYAIRARLAIAVSVIDVELCEVTLRDKPQQLLAISPKGTVPVLQLSDGRVLEQSLDIMLWALADNDPQDWLRVESTHTTASRSDVNGTDRGLAVNDSSSSALTITLPADMLSLIAINDGAFKQYLDRYKYADRYPQHSAAHYRTQGEQFLSILDTRLNQHTYLLDDRISLADMAILPFVRQFAHVDRDWFYASRYRALINWLDNFLNSPLFASVMQK